MINFNICAAYCDWTELHLLMLIFMFWQVRYFEHVYAFEVGNDAVSCFGTSLEMVKSYFWLVIISGWLDSGLEISPGLGLFLAIQLWKMKHTVSSGSFHAFQVVFFPLEYILTIHPHSTYVIVNDWKCLKSKRPRPVKLLPSPCKTINVYI